MSRSRAERMPAPDVVEAGASRVSAGASTSEVDGAVSRAMKTRGEISV